MTNPVTTWTGWHADALREALRTTNEEFAEHLDVAVRTVAYWRARPGMVLRQGTQQILDVALERAPELAKEQFRRRLSGEGPGSPPAAAPALHPASPAALTEWLTATGTSDEMISGIERAAAALADAHPVTPARVLLGQARDVQARIQRLLIEGRLRHRQERDLLRLDGEVLAHMSLLWSDLNAGQAADDYGQAALLYLREADADEAAAWYVLAKNARWQRRHAEAADMAQRGLRQGASGPMAVQLACYEANAAALAGDAARARAAMRHAEELAAGLPVRPASPSPWAFPPERMAIFRVSVAVHTGDPDRALRAASDGDGEGVPSRRVPAAWAQIRIAAGIACLLKDEPDGAAEQIRPMLDLPVGLRVATVTGWLADLGHRLDNERYAGVQAVAELREQIREFNTAAAETQRANGEGNDA